MKRPVWLLDIDGVINALANEYPTQIWPQGQWVTVHMDFGSEGTVRVDAAEPVLEFIRKVHAKRAAEIRWHTTWQKEALRLAEALDLPELWVQEAAYEFDNREDYLRRDKWWKYPAAWRVVGQEKRPLVWTDDDIVDLVQRDVNSLASAGQTLLIAPTSTYGLTKQQLGRIAEFLDVDL
jgi:hypothetical protein